MPDTIPTILFYNIKLIIKSVFYISILKLQGLSSKI